MRLLEEKILKDGKCLPGEVLKVDNFLNHQIDPVFMDKLAKEFYRLYKKSGVTKILTIEASGIAVATLTALRFGVPVVFAKKSKSSNIGDGLYTAKVASYTHGVVNDIVVSKDFLCKGDKVLIIDDFLARGSALMGLIALVEQAGAETVGAGIVIEKAFQDGGKIIRDMGVRVESLARIASMDDNGTIAFCK